MRLLHTSDWHLGRSLHGHDLAAAQGAFVDSLVDVVRSERVDAVVLAGDVHDRALPPVEAMQLFDDALRRIIDAGAAVVAISGNHDAPARLGDKAGLLDRRVALRTDPARVADPVVLEDEHGPVAFYAVPYLEPAAVRDVLPGADLEGPGPGAHTRVLSRAMRAVHADRAERGGRSVVAGPRLGHRRRGQRERARHQRRGRRQRAVVALRRRRLHRARPPAPAAVADRGPALLRLPAALLLRRGRSRQAELARRARPRRARRGDRGARPGPPPAHRPARPAGRAAREPAPRGRRGRLRLRRPHRPGQAARRHGRAAPPVPLGHRAAPRAGGPGGGRRGELRRAHPRSLRRRGRRGLRRPTSGPSPTRLERELLREALEEARRAEDSDLATSVPRAQPDADLVRGAA